MTRLVVVGSTGDAKFIPTNNVFKAFFPDVTVKKFAASSDVPDQPFGHDETMNGARNRALNTRKQNPNAWLTIGIESGIMEQGSQFIMMSYFAIDDGKTCYITSSSAMHLPSAWCVALKQNGGDLTQYLDSIGLHTENKDGVISYLTNQQISRAAVYESTLKLALAPWLHPELY